MGKAKTHSLAAQQDNASVYIRVDDIHSSNGELVVATNKKKLNWKRSAVVAVGLMGVFACVGVGWYLWPQISSSSDSDSSVRLCDIPFSEFSFLLNLFTLIFDKLFFLLFV
jgi:hypothetical protein